ncbi:MAG: AAA family ATPase [Anaerolineales bacterium]|nr:AAA family ATPase [Anaerolineales bacterium]
MQPIYLFAGSPASGKTTASRALAAKFSKSIAINVDDLREMVVSGIERPGPEWSPAFVEQLQLVRKSVTDMAKTYNAAGFAVVIDDFWDPNSRLREYADLFALENMQRVLFYPDRQLVHARNLLRSGPGPLRDYLDEGIRLVYSNLETCLNALKQDGWLVLDTTNDTVDDTVARLYELVA